MSKADSGSGTAPAYIFEWSPRPYIEPFHWHSSMEIGLCLSGKGRFYFSDKTYAVSPGDVFVVNHLERHIAQSDAEHPSNYLFVYFRPEHIGDDDRELLLPFVYNPKTFDNKISGTLPVAGQIGTCMLQMRREQERQEAGYRSMMRSLLLQMCSWLLRHYSGRRDGKRSSAFDKTFGQYRQLQPALAFLREHFREDVRLEDVAEQLKLSSSRTRHLFKLIMGDGFKEYLTQLRINEAKKLLEHTDRPVTDVAFGCGFQNVGPFYRAFRHLSGMTPQAYREKALRMGRSRFSDEFNAY